jgi:endogenous inhibitor of DNA gyrase (YacG/DUF329 family)
MTKKVNCPNCHTIVPWQDDQQWKPFCSERCKLIDLGEWATEGHRIAGAPVQTEIDELKFPDYH